MNMISKAFTKPGIQKETLKIYLQIPLPILHIKNDFVPDLYKNAKGKRDNKKHQGR